MMQRMAILVVDESRDLCESLDLLYTSYGHTVHTCQDIGAAREIIKGPGADAVLIETCPPAPEVAQFIKEIRTAGPSLILQTGSDVSPHRAAEIVAASDSDGWADKPLDAMGVIRRLRLLAQRSF